MVKAWCRMLARTLLGRPRTGAPPGQPHCWRGGAPGGRRHAPPGAQILPGRSIDCDPDDGADSPDAGAGQAPGRTRQPGRTR
jgi:hypothetical protein